MSPDITIRTESVIKTDISNHVKVECSSVYSSWYVGIAQDPRERLFTGHKVNEKGDAWILRYSSSSTVARNIEKYFIDLGMDGGSGGGDKDTTAVYAYKKTSHSEP